MVLKTGTVADPKYLDMTHGMNCLKPGVFLLQTDYKDSMSVPFSARLIAGVKCDCLQMAPPKAGEAPRMSSS